MDDVQKAQALSALRSVLIAVGGYAAGQHWIGPELVDQLVPALIVLVTLAWGVIEKKKPA